MSGKIENKQTILQLQSKRQIQKKKSENRLQLPIDTRKILVQSGEGKKEDKKKVLNGIKEPKGAKIPTYYIPGYLRIKVKNFTQLNLDNLNAKVNVAIIFTLYYGSLIKDKASAEQDDIYKSISRNVTLLFGRDDPIRLTAQNLEIAVKHEKEKQSIQFTVRKIFQLRIQNDVFWSPFQIINLIFSITVQPISVREYPKQENEIDEVKQKTLKEKAILKVNLMDFESNNFLKMSFTQEGTFGNYDLAQSRMTSQYTNNRVFNQDSINLNKQSREKPIRKLEEDFKKIKETVQNNEIGENVSKYYGDFKKIQHFQYAHFNIPLYKYPMVAMATIFLPLLLLSVINLGIFFQDNGLADRIASIAALMIAFVALIPSIRAQIPPNPKIVFVEILVYFDASTTLLALIHSIDVRHDSGFDLDWRQSGLFLAALIICIITFFFVVCLMLLHYFYWEPQYNRNIDDQYDEKFDRKLWNNYQCDLYFSIMNLLYPGKIKHLDQNTNPIQQA